jgi:hypothetical protein
VTCCLPVLGDIELGSLVYMCVPGHGDLATPEDVRNFRDYLFTLRDDVATAQAQGKSEEELSDSVSGQIKQKYADWGFQQFIPRNIQQTAAELKGEKKVPVAPPPGAGQQSECVP